MFIRGITIAILVLALDFFSKYWLLFELNLPEIEPVKLNNFANLVVVWNRGVSFGILSKHPENLAYLLSFFAILVSIFLLRLLYKAKTKFIAIAFGLIIGGALGNVVDRLRMGAVFDFLDLHAFGYHWPAFNVADSAIVVGVICLMTDSLWNKPKK